MAIPAISYGPYYRTSLRAAQVQRRALGQPDLTPEQIAAERYGEIAAYGENLRANDALKFNQKMQRSQAIQNTRYANIAEKRLENEENAAKMAGYYAAAKEINKLGSDVGFTGPGQTVAVTSPSPGPTVEGGAVPASQTQANATGAMQTGWTGTTNAIANIASPIATFASLVPGAQLAGPIFAAIAGGARLAGKYGPDVYEATKGLFYGDLPAGRLGQFDVNAMTPGARANTPAYQTYDPTEYASPYSPMYGPQAYAYEPGPYTENGQIGYTPVNGPEIGYTAYDALTGLEAAPTPDYSSLTGTNLDWAGQFDTTSFGMSPYSDYSTDYGPWADAFGITADAGGGGGVGTVICTELHRQGILDDETYHADSAFGKTVPSDVLIGYQVWGVHVASAMRRSRLLTFIVSLFAVPWAMEMSYRMGVRKNGHIIGKVMNLVGIPICRTIGRFILTRRLCHG